MKKCTWCGQEYPDGTRLCATDGQPLEPDEQTNTPKTPSQLSLSNGRPVPITIICIIGIAIVLLSLPSFPRMARILKEVYGDLYVLFWVTSLFITVTSLIGYWLMRRWGVYLYAATFVIGTAYGLVAGIPFTLGGVLVPIGISAIGIAYIRRMR